MQLFEYYLKRRYGVWEILTLGQFSFPYYLEDFIVLQTEGSKAVLLRIRSIWVVLDHYYFAGFFLVNQISKTRAEREEALASSKVER